MISNDQPWQEGIAGSSGTSRGGSTRRSPSEVLLGLGANIGDPLAQLRAAIEKLSSLMRIETVSDVYRTEPVGVKRQPDFSNLVVRGSTEHDLAELFRGTQAIERDLGRTGGVRYGPRLIDIDILAFADEVLSSERLVVPHPWLHRRAFVLVPLVEIAPGWRHPVLNETAEEMLSKLRVRSGVERSGPLDLDAPLTVGHR